MEAIPGSLLEKKCKARAEQGYLDALILSVSECPDCIDERRERERRMASACGSYGCPFMPLVEEEDECASACKAAMAYRAIKDSPYKGQLRGILRIS